MVVAEEYERRAKSCSRKIGANNDGQEIELLSPSFSVSAGRFDGVWKKFGEEIVMWVLEPKSQVGLAAVNGVFSA